MSPSSRSRSSSTGSRSTRPRARCWSTRPRAATSRSRSSVTSRSSAGRSAPAACAWSRSRGSRSSRPPARPRSATGWSSTRAPTACMEAQNAVVEFLLVNHPLDCPVCDKGGECPLQDIAMGWGPGRSRVTDPKRHFRKPVPLSPLVRIDRERCILCYRCVRFSQEVAEDEQLQLLERGASSYVGTFDDRPYIAPFHGNIIELCPVGALTVRGLPLPRPALGHRGRGLDLHPLPEPVQRQVHGPRRARPAGARPRQPRGRRRLALRQGPLRLPDDLARRSGSPSRASAATAPDWERRSATAASGWARASGGSPRSSAARPRTRRATWSSGSSAGRSARRT